MLGVITVDKRLTIGFLIHHLDNDYSKALLKGACEAAKELDVNLAIFPGRSLNSQLDDKKYTTFEYQNNVIYSYVSSKSLDACVVSAGTLGSFVSKEEFKAFLDEFEELPIVTTENKVEGYPCIRLSSSGIKDMVTHLATKHGRKNIAFVSGPKGNADAEERLNYYKEALKENHIPFDENLVAYGKFSEYCVDIVGDLIDRNNGAIDAICFANDMMCKGGYKAIERRGLRVGFDIAVTGYDDSEIAISLKPMLSTVRADASKLGYRAMIEAVNAANHKPVDDISLSSSPVYRFSCGCMKQPSAAIIAENIGENLEYSVDLILSENISRYSENKTKYACIEGLRDFICHLLRYSKGEGEGADELFVKSGFIKILDDEFESLVSPEAFVRILKSMRAAALDLCESNSVSDERRLSVSRLIENCLITASERLVSMHYNKLDDMTFTHFLIGNITKDMTIYGSDQEKCYFSIVNNLYRIHINSSYIYTYDEAYLHSAKSRWTLPGTVYLRAYHDGDRLAAVTGEAQKIPCFGILNNEYTPNDRRRTMVISPLFMNEEQYGAIVCELEHSYFSYIYSLTPQICTAIKLTTLVAQLETSLDAAQSRNNQLNRMSMIDELTGIYNRRGFYVTANRILKATENEGKNAVLIFGDLDNLKTINDTFGHDDGDYAIVSAANFIKGSLRTSDVVGRIGGDEYAAFAICENKEIISKLPSRIKNIAKLHNLRSSKPYNVTISIGLYELVCSPTLNIQEFMDKADSALYEDKKKKNRDIMKHREDEL